MMNPILGKLVRWSAGIKVLTMLLAIIIVYNHDLILVANEAWLNESSNHILAVPFLILYVMYRKRRMLGSVLNFEESTASRKILGHILMSEIIGGLFCILAFLLYSWGSYTFYPLQIHMMSLPIFIIGCVLVMFNKETLMTLIFPITLLFFLTPPPITIFSAVANTLSSISAEAAHAVLEALAVPVTLSLEYGAPVLILQNSYFLTVDRACSGLNSLAAFTIFALFIAYIVRGSTLKKSVIFLVGFPLIYGLNILRITGIALIAYNLSSELATQLFHLIGGWVLLIIAAPILLLTFEKILKIKMFVREPVLSEDHHTHRFYKDHNFCLYCGRILENKNLRATKRDLCKVFALLTSSMLILYMQVPIFSISQTIKISMQTPSGEKINTQVLPEVNGYRLIYAYRDTAFEAVSGEDAALFYVYIPTDPQGITEWVAIEIADSLSKLHGWEVCTYVFRVEHGLQPQAVPVYQQEVQVLQNPPVIGQYVVLQYTGSSMTQAIIYWFESIPIQVESRFEQRYVKISIIVSVTPEDYSKVQSPIISLAESIVANWQRTKSQSWIAPIIPQYGLPLLITTSIFLVSILSLQVIQTEKRKKSNFRAFNRLALKEEKTLLQAVHQTGARREGTLDKIAAAYEKMTEKSTDPDILLQKLGDAEKAGLVKSEMESFQDKPILVWKSEISFSKHSA